MRHFTSPKFQTYVLNHPFAPSRVAGRMAVCLFVIGVMAFPSGISAAEKANAHAYWRGVATEVSASLDQALVALQNGDAKAAKRSLTQAYFGVFEDRKLEAAIRKTFGKDRAYEIERGFADVRHKIGTGVVADVKASRDALVGLINFDADALDEKKVSQNVYDVR